jgi:hypothetical protein
MMGLQKWYVRRPPPWRVLTLVVYCSIAAKGSCRSVASVQRLSSSRLIMILHPILHYWYSIPSALNNRKDLQGLQIQTNKRNSETTVDQPVSCDTLRTILNLSLEILDTSAGYFRWVNSRHKI